MKKSVFILLTLLAGAFAVSSCHEEQINFEKEINGTLNFETFSLNLDEPTQAEVRSRAVADINDFIVVLCSAADEELQSWKYSEMPSVLVLSVGNYKLKAHTPLVEGAQFDAPYCYGESALFEIKKDEVTDAGEVKCVLKSIKITIKYADDLFALMGDDAKVTVTLGNEVLEFVKDETRSGFFHAESESNSVHVRYNAILEGSPVESNKLYTDVKMGTELIITYNMKESQGDPETGGTVTPGGIEIDENCEIIDLSFNVLPNDDIIGDFGKPSVKGRDFDIAEPVTDLSKPVVVLLNAPEGMAHVNVNISSTSAEFQGAVGAIFATLPFDLAEPGELEGQLTELGFPIKEQIIGQQGVVEFDITSFLGPLAAFSGTHTFSIEVVDAYGDKANADLVIVVASKE